MNQLFTIAKVGGRTGEQILSRIAALQRIDSRDENGCKQIQDACTAIYDWVERHATTPPVIFYCRYADLWSGGDLFQKLLGEEYGVGPVEDFDCAIALVLRLTESDKLSAYIEQRLRGNLQFDEDRMFLDIMLKGIRAWSGLCKNGTLLVFREVVGPTVTDEELRASLESEWFVEGDFGDRGSRRSR
jgi:hypothetical protein